jgi:hypothetical protein
MEEEDFVIFNVISNYRFIKHNAGKNVERMGRIYIDFGYVSISQFLIKLNIQLPHNPANCPSHLYPRNRNLHSYINLFTNICGRFPYNSEKLETTSMFLDMTVFKPTLLQSQNGVPLSAKPKMSRLLILATTFE